MPSACVIVPAFDAATTLASVIVDLRAELPALADAIIVVDDGSRDGTAGIAREHGCVLVSQGDNLGKGAALLRGFEEARARGKTVAVTVDADGQHLAADARAILEAHAHDERALVLGVRELERDGAPKANRISNRISNYFLSRFAHRDLRDTQCGLRRYPIAETLALGARGRGYDFEAEVILRAIWAGLPVHEHAVRVLYPADRTTHFHVARDPWRIVRTVAASVGEHWLRPARPDARFEEAE